ncbi:MAG: Tn3 family transposase, partial [Chitinimonas sp.]|nr:Tn3 family transposase [Chitinimonas sp.]
DLVALSLILQNTVDLMRSMRDLEKEGWVINEEDVSFLSPYQVGHVKRFGEYNLKFRRVPEDWISEESFKQAAAAAAQRTRSRKAGKTES